MFKEYTTYREREKERRKNDMDRKSEKEEKINQEVSNAVLFVQLLFKDTEGGG